MSHCICNKITLQKSNTNSNTQPIYSEHTASHFFVHLKTDGEQKRNQLVQILYLATIYFQNIW